MHFVVKLLKTNNKKKFLKAAKNNIALWMGNSN